MDTMDERQILETAAGAAATTAGDLPPQQGQARGADGAPEMRAALPDEASVSAEIAALYLRMSPADLADSQKEKRPAGRAEKNVKAPSPPTSYTLGALRELGKRHAASAGLEAALKAGTIGWMSAKLPFFAELEPRVKRGRRVLIASAWDAAGPEREARFADLVDGRIRFTWLTSAEAATSLWGDEASHRAFVARGLALLEGEVRAIQAAIGATEQLAAGSSAAADKPAPH